MCLSETRFVFSLTKSHHSAQTSPQATDCPKREEKWGLLTLRKNCQVAFEKWSSRFPST